MGPQKIPKIVWKPGSAIRVELLFTVTVHTVMQDVVCRPATNTALHTQNLAEETEEQVHRHRHCFSRAMRNQSVAINRRRHRADNKMYCRPGECYRRPLVRRSKTNPSTESNRCNMNSQHKYPSRRIEGKALCKQLPKRLINGRIAQLRCHFTFHGQTTLFRTSSDVSTFQK